MKELHGKAIYTPNGAAREYAAYGVRIYKGCPHGCKYCYLKRGVLSKELGREDVQLKKCFKDEWDALGVFAEELKKNLSVLQEHGLFFTFTSDPLIKDTRMVTLVAVGTCTANRVPVTLLTKDATFVDNVRVMDALAKLTPAQRKMIAFGFTLTGHDELEPNASTNLERIKAMRQLAYRGFHTWASIEPVIDFETSLRMIKESADCCEHYKIGLRSGVKKDYYNPEECIGFIKDVNDFLAPRIKVYWKESVRNLIKDWATLDIIDKDPHSVGREYSMFNR